MTGDGSYLATVAGGTVVARGAFAIVMTAAIPLADRGYVVFIHNPSGRNNGEVIEVRLFRCGHIHADRPYAELITNEFNRSRPHVRDHCPQTDRNLPPAQSA